MIRRRDFLKTAASLAAGGSLYSLCSASVPASARRARRLTIRHYVPREGAMVPAGEESLGRVYFTDVDYNPLMAPARFGGTKGELVADEPRQKYKITCADWVDGFGYTYLIADNGGGGYEPGELPAEILLNRELAESRLESVETARNAARRSGVVFASEVGERLEKSRNAFAAAAGSNTPEEAARKFWLSLNESLWAGEMVSVENARHAIARRGARPEFRFGANAFGSLTHGESYTRHFYDIFDYCTLPFYYKGFEPEYKKPTWERLDRMVEWCRVGGILPKGHPLLWMHEAGVPRWLEDKSFDNVRNLHKHRIKRIVNRYRGAIDYWDVINEAHDFANVLNYTYDQLFDLTAMCCETARAANPDCVSIVNSTALWGEYAAPKPGKPLPAVPKRTAYQYVADCVSQELDFDVIGLQIYFPNRDIFEIDRMLERFGRFGKEVHITEHSVSSDTSDDEKSHVKKVWGHWHAPFSPAIQADFLEQLWTVAYSKQFIQAITYWDFSDKGGHFWPHGGFLDAEGEPKEVYFRLKKLVDSWKAA